MNKRIREISEAADFYVGNEHYDKSREEQQKLLMAKFAELIVQECIDIISPYTIRMGRPGEEYFHPILEIRKNFGVEE